MSNNNELMNAALTYASNGWAVFPCAPNTKVPLMGTHGIKDATTDVALIRAWWSREPNANVAIACGKTSGIYVVDIDVDVGRNINGYDSVNEGELTPTAYVNTPRGGLHMYYRCESEPPRSKNNFRRGIDIRGDGYYVLAPPSKHPNGGVYQWGAYGQFAEYPDVFKPQEASPVVAPWREAVPVQPQRQDAASVNRPSIDSEAQVIERARAYLALVEPAVQGMGGHNSLLKAAAKLVTGFGLSDSVALSLLWQDYNPRCVPPWDASNPRDVKDFERKVSEARKAPRIAENSLRDSCDEETSMLDTLGTELAFRIAKSKTIEDESIKKDRIDEKPIKKDSNFPDEILHPPGLVGQLVDWIDSTAGCPQRGLAVACALSACGALFGRKVKDEYNSRTNLFVLGVGASSSGKDHAPDCVQRLFTEAGGTDYLMGSITSDTAIERGLVEHPVKLMIIDEFGDFAGSINKAGENTGYLKTIKPTMMQLYSSAHKIFIGKQKAQGEPVRVEQPCLSLYGMTAPDKFYNSLTRDELRDGWLARMLVFITKTRPRYQAKKSTVIPAAIVEQFRAWIDRVITAPPEKGKGDIDQALAVNQLVIPTSPAAEALFDEYSRECYDLMIEAGNRGDDTEFLYGKATQNARRIALIVAAGENFEGAVIDEDEARYGIAVARYNVEAFKEAIEGNLAESIFQKDKQRLTQIVVSAGSDGISRSALTRKSQWIRDKHIRDRYMQDLVEARIVIVGQKEGAGDALWFWSANSPCTGLVDPSQKGGEE